MTDPSTAPLTFRPFLRIDWDAFAGAEVFPDATDPVLVDGTLGDGCGWVVVLDPTGGRLQIAGDTQAEHAGGYRLLRDFVSAAAAESWFRATIGHPTHRRQFTRAGFRQDRDHAGSSDMAAENARLLREDIYRQLDSVGADLDHTFGRGRWEQVHHLDALRLALIRLHNKVRGLPPDDAGSILALERRLTAQRR